MELMKQLSPDSKKQMAQKMMEIRMQEMEDSIQEHRNKKPRTITCSNSSNEMLEASALTDQGEKTPEQCATIAYPTQYSNEKDTMLRLPNGALMTVAEYEEIQHRGNDIL